MAASVFGHGNIMLEVGKAGSNSQTRYIRQHYNVESAPSTSAASLVKRGEGIALPDLSNELVSEWIKTHTDRINLVPDPEVGIDDLCSWTLFSIADWNRYLRALLASTTPTKAVKRTLVPRAAYRIR